MKTTIEVSDHILNRARLLGRKRGVTLRALVEEGLTRVLDEESARGKPRIKPVTFKGRGLQPEFRDGAWNRIRDAVYEGRGS